MTGFNDAQREYAHALAVVQGNDARKRADAYERCVEKQQKAQIEYQRAYDAAFRTYQEAPGQGDSEEAEPATAYLTFAAEVSRAQMAAARSLAEAQHKAEGTLRDAWFESQDELRDAYEEYVRALQAAWSSVGAEGLDPRGLVYAANSIGAAATFAASTLGTDLGARAKPAARGRSSST